MLKKIMNFFKDDPSSVPDTPENEPLKKPIDPEAFTMDDIKVYALSTCIHCRNAKRYLDECGIKYNCVHMDKLTGDERKAAVAELKEYNPAVSFPTIIIKNTVVVGYHKDQIDKALGSE